jgi:hypothetical protein
MADDEGDDVPDGVRDAAAAEPDETPTEVDDGETDDGSDGTYGGLLGAFPYAFRQSESRLFRAYVALGGLLAALVVAVFALAIVDLLGATAAAQGGTFTFSRAFFVVIMLGVLAPLVAPVLLVARRHRRTGSSKRYDIAMAGVGFGFIFSVYLGLALSTPPAQQSQPSGPFAPVVAVLWALPRIVGFVPPLVVVVILFVVHRRLADTTAGPDTA